MLLEFRSLDYAGMLKVFYVLLIKTNIFFLIENYLFIFFLFFCQAYNALQTQLNTECALTQSEVTETENKIKELERTWNHLQVMHKQYAHKSNANTTNSYQFCGVCKQRINERKRNDFRLQWFAVSRCSMLFKKEVFCNQSLPNLKW